MSHEAPSYESHQVAYSVALQEVLDLLGLVLGIPAKSSLAAFALEEAFCM